MPSKKLKLSVYLSQEEHQKITANAAQARLSFSRFARAVCLGHVVRSLNVDQHILELRHLKADLGRLGGLLKLWLSNPDENAVDVRRVLRTIEDNQKKLQALAVKLDRSLLCTRCANRQAASSSLPRAASGCASAATPPAGHEPGGWK